MSPEDDQWPKSDSAAVSHLYFAEWLDYEDAGQSSGRPDRHSPCGDTMTRTTKAFAPLALLTPNNPVLEVAAATDPPTQTSSNQNFSKYHPPTEIDYSLMRLITLGSVFSVFSDFGDHSSESTKPISSSKAEVERPSNC